MRPGGPVDRTRLVDRAELMAQTAAAIAGLTAVFVLIGWALGIPTLKSIAPNLPAMKPNTAVALVLIAVAIFVRTRRRVAIACASAATAIAAATLLEYVTTSNFGIDQLLFRDVATASSRYP